MITLLIILVLIAIVITFELERRERAYRREVRATWWDADEDDLRRHRRRIRRHFEDSAARWYRR